MDDLAAMKERARAVWALGDYPEVARHFEGVAAGLVAACDVEPGWAVLDIAAGNGNVAVAAALAGASVTACDFTPELVAEGEARTAGMDVRWDVADAEDLPYDDEAFDAALSVFGLMFAPRPDVAIAEAFRVVRPGGVVGLCAWTPEGLMGQMGATIGRFLPPAPGAARPVDWGDEALARRRVGPHAAEVHVARDEVAWRFGSEDEAVAWQERTFGVLHAARAALGDDGYAELRSAVTALMREWNTGEDGGFAVASEYLRVVAVAG